MGSRPPQRPHSPTKALAATKPIRNEGRKSSGDGAGCQAPGGGGDRLADSSLLQGLRACLAPKRGALWGPGVPPTSLGWHTHSTQPGHLPPTGPVPR